METFENLKDRLDNLVGAELNKAKAWRNAGQVRRRWYAFIAGVIVGVAAVLLLSALGCSESPKSEQVSGEYRLFYKCGGTGSVCVYSTPESPRAVQTGPNSACFPGPKVVAE